jgi:hypothetical protein
MSIVEDEMTQPQPSPAPPRRQMDDNIDDLGRKPDGTELDQPQSDDKAIADALERPMPRTQHQPKH